MTEKLLTLRVPECALLLISFSLMAAAGIYAWLVTDLLGLPDVLMRWGLNSPQGWLVSVMRDYPLMFLVSLSAGSGAGALTSIALRRQGLLQERGKNIEHE